MAFHDRNTKQKTRDKFKDLPADELSFILGRYCGPSNSFLSIKNFGFVVNKEIIEQLLVERLFEETILC